MPAKPRLCPDGSVMTTETGRILVDYFDPTCTHPSHEPMVHDTPGRACTALVTEIRLAEAAEAAMGGPAFHSMGGNF